MTEWAFFDVGGRRTSKRSIHGDVGIATIDSDRSIRVFYGVLGNPKVLTPERKDFFIEPKQLAEALDNIFSGRFLGSFDSINDITLLKQLTRGEIKGELLNQIRKGVDVAKQAKLVDFVPGTPVGELPSLRKFTRHLVKQHTELVHKVSPFFKVDRDFKSITDALHTAAVFAELGIDVDFPFQSGPVLMGHAFDVEIEPLSEMVSLDTGLGVDR